MATVNGTANPDTIDGTATQDSLTGAAGNDLLRFAPGALGANDTVSGGSGFDTVSFTASGAVAAGTLTNLANIERIQHAAGGANSYQLGASIASLSLNRTLEIVGGSGADSVNGSLIVDPTHILRFTTNAGADTFVGGAGNDFFTVNAAAAGARYLAGNGGNDTVTVGNVAHWTAADVFAGSAGTDRLVLAGGGTANAAFLAGLSSVEQIKLSEVAAATLVVNNALVAQAGGVLTVIGGAATAQVVDASAVTAGGVVYRGGSGAGDSFRGGAGADRFETADATGGATLGGGNDTLVLTALTADGIVAQGGQGSDRVILGVGGSWNLAGLTGFETVQLNAAATVATPGTTALRVLGSASGDAITLGGLRQVVFGYGGDDTVTATAAQLAGAALNGGGGPGGDMLQLSGNGIYDFRRGNVVNFERIEVLEGAAPGLQILLGNAALDLVLNSAAQVRLGVQALQTAAGSEFADQIFLGAAGQFVDGGGGGDVLLATAAMLAAGTVVVGGDGLDQLNVQGGGTVDLRTGAFVTDVERIVLETTTMLTLDAVEGIEVIGSGGADTVLAGAAGLSGDLGGAADLLVATGAMLADAPGTLAGGAGRDTLKVLATSGTSATFVLSERFSGFEVLDLDGLFTVAATLIGTEARDIQLSGFGYMTLQGSEGAEAFLDPDFGEIRAGGGADTIRVDNYVSESLTIDGEAGDDLLVIDRRTGFGYVLPESTAVERVMVLGGSYTANSRAGLVMTGDGTLSVGLNLNGNFQIAQGGSGNDNLSNSGGLGTTLVGGDGSDFYNVDAARQSVWDTPGQVIQDNGRAGDLNVLRLGLNTGTATLSIFFEEHSVSFIDRIDINTYGAGARFTFAVGMGLTADGNNDGTTGDLVIQAPAATPIGTTVGQFFDAAAFGLGERLLVSTGFDGADTLIGGAGADSLSGGRGADSIVGGEGADGIAGGFGGDIIRLTETTSSADQLRYVSADDGTADIDNDTSIAASTADSIIGFAPVTDRITLSQSGLGITAGGVVEVAPGGAWSLNGGGLFVFESESAGRDVIAGNNFAALSAIQAAINTSNGQAVGAGAARTVGLVVSNDPANATRATGIWLWTDTDGDGVLEAADTVRLLGVIQGVTANQIAASDSIFLVA
jgi:hypothetical protein